MMENHPGSRSDYHRIAAANSPPHAPMAMPEQVLRRQSGKAVFMTFVRHLLVWG